MSELFVSGAAGHKSPKVRGYEPGGIFRLSLRFLHMFMSIKMYLDTAIIMNIRYRADLSSSKVMLCIILRPTAVCINIIHRMTYPTSLQLKTDI